MLNYSSGNRVNIRTEKDSNTKLATEKRNLDSTDRRGT